MLVCGGWAGGRGGWVHVGSCENLRATRQNLRAIRQNLRAHPTAPHRPTRLTPRLRPNHIPHPRTFTPHLIPRPPPHVCMCRRSVCGRSMCVWVVRRGGDGAGEVSWGAGGRAGERGGGGREERWETRRRMTMEDAASVGRRTLRFSTVFNHVGQRSNGHATPVDRVCSSHAHRKQNFAASRGVTPLVPPKEHPVEYGG